MTRYRIRISDAALAALHLDPLPGFRLVDAGFPDRLHAEPAGWQPSRIATVEDDDAPPDLEGCLVEVTVSRDAPSGTVWISHRRAVEETGTPPP